MASAAPPAVLPVILNDEESSPLCVYSIHILRHEIEANAHKFMYVWRKSVEREDPEELTSEELEEVVQKLEETVGDYEERIEASRTRRSQPSDF